jgi:hypothetical protein
MNGSDAILPPEMNGALQRLFSREKKEEDARSDAWARRAAAPRRTIEFDSALLFLRLVFSHLFLHSVVVV